MHALICSRTVLQKHSCSTYILLLAAANLSLLSLRREPFSALMLPHRSSMPFSNHLSCDALNSTLEIQFSGLGFFCQWYVVCFVLLKQVWWRLSPQTVWICYCLPIWNVTSVINPLWWFSFFLALAIHFCEGQYQVTSPLCLQEL